MFESYSHEENYRVAVRHKMYAICMKYLGLDVGTKRTGAAFADSDDDILFSLETIHHASEAELFSVIRKLVTQYRVDEVVLGMPLLPGGSEGKQTETVYSLLKALTTAKIPCSILDERYTSQKQQTFDSDAAAACEILAVKLKRKGNIGH